MSNLKYPVGICIVSALMLWAGGVRAADAKFCGVVVHDISTGKLARNSSEIAAYKKLNPLPVGFDPTEWQVDHTLPLKCGGCDTVTNLAWMHKSIKICAYVVGGPYCKDRYERKIFCSRPVTHIYIP